MFSIKFIGLAFLTLTLGALLVRGEDCDGDLEHAYFYTNAFCEGRPAKSVCGRPGWNDSVVTGGEMINANYANLDPGLLSVRILGLWSFGLEIFGSGVPRYFSYFQGFPPNGSRCISKQEMLPAGRDNWRDHGIYTYTNYVSNFTSHLFLMEEEDFQGEDIWIWRDNSRIIYDPLKIKSFVHFSNDTWIIYEERSFRGEMKCLCATKRLDDGSIIPLPEDSEIRKPSVNMTFGSVKKDVEGLCNCLEQ